MRSRLFRRATRNGSGALPTTILGVVLLALQLAVAPAAQAAVRYEFTLLDDGTIGELYHPYGVATDPAGNIYVADTGHHRIVKFDRLGIARFTFGSFGAEPGILFYPEGVAVGADPVSGAIRIYVANTSNNKVSVFDDHGRLVREWGTQGSGDGQLDNPSGIAVSPPQFGSHVFVVDTRNRRVVRYSSTGVVLQTYTCSTCPGGQFDVPKGIAIRELNRTFQLYVTDEFAGRVHVLHSGGAWLRSFASKGTGDDQLHFPDKIAVDSSGNAYVADPGSVPRVSKFDPAGKFLFFFNTTGSEGFISPHGLTLDQEGNLYVANTGESNVHKFKIEAPKLLAAVAQERAFWLDTKGAYFAVQYNGVEQTCLAQGVATVTVPLRSGSRTFNLRGSVTAAFRTDFMKMDMTDKQAGWIKQVWDRGKKIRGTAQFTARCEDGTPLSATEPFTK